jgi:hypothetical protein
LPSNLRGENRPSFPVRRNRSDEERTLRRPKVRPMGLGRSAARSAAMVALAAAAIAGLTGGAPDASVTSDPANIRIVTSDIPNFWRAFDRAAGASSQEERATIFKREYFIPGTDGLWGFINDRLRSPWYVAKVTQQRRADYERVRSVTAEMPSTVPAIVTDLKRLKDFYPDAVFPTIYFVIGTFNSGGTISDGVGDILGAEILADVGIDRVPALVTHETIHWNQHDADESTVLSFVLNEGSADFLADLADGRVETDATWQFGCAHEAALWALLTQQAKSQDDKTITSWVFSEQAPMGAPPYIGYWVGYRIMQTYYANATDKKAAISDMLHIKDFPAFVSASGYPAKKPPCRRVARWGTQAGSMP